MMTLLVLLLGFFPFCSCYEDSTSSAGAASTPVVINTWAFPSAAEAAWEALESGKSALDALEIGCSTCEDEQCKGTVGFGGSPDENGETTLDAMVFNGDTMEMGSVAGLRRIKNASSVARRVMEHSGHSILAGSLAAQFAKRMGFKEESLSTNASQLMWAKWKESKCQPNFWKNVVPDPNKSCGPYKPISKSEQAGNDLTMPKVEWLNHDTIGMVVIDSHGSVVAGTSTNGLKFKIPGRVGDAAIPGAGAYADSTIGAAVATGNGDVMMRFLPTATIVEMMRNGASPQDAVRKLIKRIAKFYPTFSGALIAVSKNGHLGVACHNIPVFPFSVGRGGSVQVINSTCSINSLSNV